MHLETIKAMDDATLMASMLRVAATIREQQARGLQLLGEIDERKLYLREGHASLWAFCTAGLKMSEAGTSRWIRAMRAVRRDPALLSKLADGRMSLCVVATLADQPKLLEKAEGKTIREAKEMLTVVTVPAGRKPVPAAPFDALLQGAPSSAPTAAARPKRERMTAKGPDLVGLSVEVEERVRRKIERAMQLRPGSGLGDVLEEAIDLFLAKVDPVERDKRRVERKARAVRTTKAPRATADAKVLPRAVRDAVIARDGARCTFTSATGNRCKSRRHLEVDHIRPRAFGGSHDLDNLRCLCSAHHRMYTNASFGHLRCGG